MNDGRGFVATNLAELQSTAGGAAGIHAKVAEIAVTFVAFKAGDVLIMVFAINRFVIVDDHLVCVGPMGVGHLSLGFWTGKNLGSAGRCC